MMFVAAQVSVLGLYLPPVLKVLLPLDPPQTIISPPLRTAVSPFRVAVAVAVLGLYLPPVLRLLPLQLIPPQTIISLPVHTAVCQRRASGALVTLVGVHVSSVQPPDGRAITGSL